MDTGFPALPMVWYVPPLSPISAAASAGDIAVNNGMPDIRSLRIPLKYLANLLTAGEQNVVIVLLKNADGRHEGVVKGENKTGINEHSAEGDKQSETYN